MSDKKEDLVLPNGYSVNPGEVFVRYDPKLHGPRPSNYHTGPVEPLCSDAIKDKTVWFDLTSNKLLLFKGLDKEGEGIWDELPASSKLPKFVVDHTANKLVGIIVKIDVKELPSVSLSEVLATAVKEEIDEE